MTTPSPSGPPPPSPGRLTEEEAAVLEHAWNWFSLHSGQRMQLLSFFFVALGLVVAGYGTALQADLPVVAGGLSVAGMVLAAAFFMADLRTRELVKASEVPLSSIQKRLADISGISSVRLVDEVETPKVRRTSYGSIIGKLMVATAVLMVAGLVYAIYLGVQSEEKADTHPGRRDDGQHRDVEPRQPSSSPSLGRVKAPAK